MSLELGDKVTWRSQANGSFKIKTGTVVAVVPAGQMPPSFPAGVYTKADISGFQRNHESYLIGVAGKTTKSKPRLYWPRVSALRGA